MCDSHCSLYQHWLRASRQWQGSRAQGIVVIARCHYALFWSAPQSTVHCWIQTSRIRNGTWLESESKMSRDNWDSNGGSKSSKQPENMHGRSPTVILMQTQEQCSYIHPTIPRYPTIIIIMLESSSLSIPLYLIYVYTGCYIDCMRYEVCMNPLWGLWTGTYNTKVGGVPSYLT